MEKRTMDKLGIDVSLLGFGCMRFPTTPDGKIDEPRDRRGRQLYRHGVPLPQRGKRAFCGKGAVQI